MNLIIRCRSKVFRFYGYSTTRASCLDIRKRRPLGLLSASELGNLSDMKEALKEGANIEMRGRYGSTPLMFSAQFGHGACLSMLLDYGASIEAEKYGTTALICAAVEGQFNCLQILLNRGANIEATDEGGMTPLLYTARYGHQGCLLLLLSRGANINSMNKTGDSPLMLALANGHHNCVEILRDKGAALP